MKKHVKRYALPKSFAKFGEVFDALIGEAMQSRGPQIYPHAHT